MKLPCKVKIQLQCKLNWERNFLTNWRWCEIKEILIMGEAIVIGYQEFVHSFWTDNLGLTRKCKTDEMN